ncbi:hypothetical protein SLEP1_g58153 [Rubroshorea leprosula]|uniref:Uncharacterized protein n=1 Tax=Rubroshorea leprosula TaxID=152421 RepID=A0AAV5MPZ2_9ROSI|nr:hypothetical protein SLEP1_g58153 [Rubroshorea leprosula]
MEGEEVVMSVEPIAMIVPPELQDLPEIFTPESSASSSTHESSSANPSSSSEGSSSEKTPNAGEDVEEGVSNPSPESAEVNVDVLVVASWENKSISGRLSNLRKAPHTLAAGFSFRANLHHEATDCATSTKGYKRLEEIVRQYHVPRTVLVRTGTKNERAAQCRQQGGYPLRAGADTVNPQQHKIYHRIYAIVSKVKDTYEGNRVQIALLVSAKYHSDEVDTRTEKVSNDLAACLSGWRLGHTYMNYPTLTPDDLELKDRITNYVKAVGLVDLEALVTLELLALRGFVDVANLFSEACWRDNANGLSAHELRELGLARKGKRALTSDRLQLLAACRKGSEAPARLHGHMLSGELNTGNQSGAVRSLDAPAAQARNPTEALPTAAASMGPRNAYPEGFSYTKADCQLVMVQGM